MGTFAWVLGPGKGSSELLVAALEVFFDAFGVGYSERILICVHL